MDTYLLPALLLAPVLGAGVAYFSPSRAVRVATLPAVAALEDRATA